MARVLLSLLLVAVAVQANDYCQYHCPNGAANLGCGHSGKPSSACVDFQHIEFEPKDRRFILDEHNRMRSLVAKGQAKNALGQKLPSAANMNELLWDAELEDLAYLNVLQCKRSHDQCHDTETHNGQNLYNILTTVNYTTQEVVNQAIRSWYDEVLFVPLNEINAYNGGTGMPITQFTQLVWAKTNRVGCALASYNYNGLKAYLMACNYVHGNELKQRVYEMGKTCEGCTDYCTEEGLCRILL